MHRLAAALAPLALAGCFTPTFTKLQPGAPIPPDGVVLVGSFTASPAIDQHHQKRDCGGMWVNGKYEPPGKVVFVQETDGNVMAFFADPSEPFDAETRAVPARYDWTYMPLSGHFFVHVPAGARRLHLRGFTYITNAGTRMFDLPAHVDIGAKDRVVYVGDIRLHRGPGRRAEFVNAIDAAKRAARSSGLGALAGAPWTVRLLRTSPGKPSAGPEWGDSCTAEKGYWKLLF
jgi:hypothetical protein